MFIDIYKSSATHYFLCAKWLSLFYLCDIPDILEPYIARSLQAITDGFTVPKLHNSQLLNIQAYI